VVMLGLLAIAVGATSRRSAGWRFKYRLRISWLASLLIAAGVSGTSAPVDARGVITGRTMGGGGSASIGSSGRTVAAPASRATSRRLSGLHGRSITSTRRFDIFADDDFDRFRDFRRFRHHRRDLDDGFFPFGFFGSWPTTELDLSAAPDDSSDDGDAPPFRRRVERYEAPTVENTPSGVTIIRGPGSHRF
jgi:hypothetical protein